MRQGAEQRRESRGWLGSDSSRSDKRYWQSRQGKGSRGGRASEQVRVGEAHAKTSALGFQEKDSMDQDEEDREEVVREKGVSTLLL